MVELALTFETPKVYEDSTALQPAKDAVIAALEQFGIQESEDKENTEYGVLYTKLPNAPITEATIDDLLGKQCWTQAILLSQIMGQSVLARTLEKYAGKANPADPFFTLALVGNGLGQKVLEMNPDLYATWPKHVAYLLKNSQICNKKYIADFLVGLSGMINESISYSAGLFVRLISGAPTPALGELWTNLGKSLRTVLLAEIIQKFWNKGYPSIEASKAVLVELYYEKALMFSSMSHLSHARNALAQINELQVLRKDWPIYSKLLNLATRLKGPAPLEEKKEGFLGYITTAVCELFPKKAEGRAAPQPREVQQPKAKEFYFDKAKGAWVINGKEADAEYDMGQEPVEPQAKGVEVAPPPLAVGMAPRSPNKPEYEEPEPAAELIKNPFGQVRTGPAAKRKGPIKSLYVSQT